MLLSDPSQPISNGSGDTAARELGSSRAAADTRPNGADRSDPMSTGDSPAQIARRVAPAGPLVVIPCGGRKLDHAAPAGELYAGSYFRANLRAALAQTPTAGCAGIGAQLSILARIAERHAA